MGTNVVDLDAILEAGVKALRPFCSVKGHEIELVVSDLEWEAWPQRWGSTALGYSGIGGQAITTAQTVVVTCPSLCYQAAVFFGGPHLAYIADIDCSSFVAACRRKNLPPQTQAGMMRNSG